MTLTAKEMLLREIAQLTKERAAKLRALKEIEKGERATNLAGDLPYISGRIATHARSILNLRGPVKREELVEILRVGGAGISNENPLKEIQKSIDRSIMIGTIRETGAGLVAAEPGKLSRGNLGKTQR